MSEAPLLKPIAEAPEGVVVQAWVEIHGSPRPIETQYKKEMGVWMMLNNDNIWIKSNDLNLADTYATHFTLWPILPRPKNSWDDYLDEQGDFFNLHNYSFEETWAVPSRGLNHSQSDMYKALRDFLNHHYPLNKDKP